MFAWLTILTWYVYVAQREEVARLLLEKGVADPRACSEGTGYTPLHTAAAAGQVAMFRVLLGAGARWHAPDHEGHTALDVAVTTSPAWTAHTHSASTPASRARAGSNGTARVSFAGGAQPAHGGV